jgi:hypothetical protein
MPDWSAGTKEFYFALIAGVGSVSVPVFRRQMFHVEHYCQVPRTFGFEG